MIDKKVWIELLRLVHASQAKGEHLNANNLVETFGFKELTYNLKYLESNNLISRENQNLDDAFGEYGLTHTGYDFLEKNGGLTREINEKLNTVFIKIDEEQFKALLIARIEKSELPKSQKESVIAEINNLPSALITHLATTLLDAGLESLPNALQSIGIGF